MFGNIVIVQDPDGNPERERDVVPAAQLIADITPAVGATGVVFGAATPLPDGLIHPFTVVVTV